MAKIKEVRSIEEIKELIQWEENNIEFHTNKMLYAGERVSHHTEKKNIKDLERFGKEIVSEGKAIAKAKKELKALKEELKKVEIEEIKTSKDPIDEFLAMWRVKAHKYFTGLRKVMVEKRSAKYPINKENLELVKRSFDRRAYSDDRIEEILKELPTMDSYKKEGYEREITSARFKEWLSLHTKTDISIIEGMGDPNHIERVLDRDVIVKKKSFIAKIEAKAGKLVDVKGLSVGVDGSLNGIAIGSERSVKVESILAGGYNVQCLHYRVLVKPIK